MNVDWQFEQIEELREDVDLEVKLSLGADGKGVLPKAFWESYSAMANTQGSYIVLGVKEKKGGQLIAVSMPYEVENWSAALFGSPRESD